jgi:acetylornithine/succinyldiaminopimelate/putrescine aminotransferase
VQLTQRQLFLQHVAQTSPAPLALEIEKAEGVWLFDVNKKKYLDFISGISVSNIGHRHPHVVKAIKDQLDQYMHLMVYGEYIQSPQVKLATKLIKHLRGLDSVYFVNSGAEAVDGALKLARRYTGRKKILSFKKAYHGSTTGALSLMDDPYFTDPFKPLLPEVYHLNPNDWRSIDLIDDETAAIFVEIIRGEAGAENVDAEFLEAISTRCKETNTLLIADEIQTGFGRTGTMFAFTPLSFTPDIIVLAKGMGGGMPIGAFCARNEVMQSLAAKPVLGHITTFGGHPVCCASALATLEVLEEIDLENRIPHLENLIREKLVHHAIKSISGKGLLLAVEMQDEETNQKVIRKCIENGLITDWFLFAPHKLRVSPPLNITDEDVLNGCEIIIKSIRSICEN